MRKKKTDPAATAAVPMIPPESSMMLPLNMAQSLKSEVSPARRAWLI